jgi:hypothetical protein
MDGADSSRFRVEWRTVVPGQVPAHLLPVRYERRE